MVLLPAGSRGSFVHPHPTQQGKEIVYRTDRQGEELFALTKSHKMTNPA